MWLKINEKMKHTLIFKKAIVWAGMMFLAMVAFPSQKIYACTPNLPPNGPDEDVDMSDEYCESDSATSSHGTAVYNCANYDELGGAWGCYWHTYTCDSSCAGGGGGECSCTGSYSCSKGDPPVTFNYNCTAQDSESACTGQAACNSTWELDGSCTWDCPDDGGGLSCTPVCNAPYCGQSNECPPGICSSSDAGVPGVPTGLNPVNEGIVPVIEGQQVTLSWWAADSLTDSYYLELYPAGTNCSTSGAYCDALAGLSYTFTPLQPSYYYRVRALNSTCSTEWGNWAGATFYVKGTISGQVRQDDSLKEAALYAHLVGGVCVPGADTGGGVQPPGSKVTVGTDYGNVNADGTYSLDSPLGLGKIAVLSIVDPWRCTCPISPDCTYSTSVPKSGLDYFVSRVKDAWWQVDEGNIHADGGSIRSSIPNTAILPFLITGKPGLASSNSGSVNIGSGTAINENLSNWQAQTKFKGSITKYGYFERILKDDPRAFTPWYGVQPGADGVYYYNGNMDTGGFWDITAEKIVILVKGNVTITEDIKVEPPGFLAIISSGNITIGNAVTNVEGVYLADGTISAGNSKEQLIAEGIFTGWGGFNLAGRDFDSLDNNIKPVIRFIYRPDLVRNAYKYLSKPKIFWQEVGV